MSGLVTRMSGEQRRAAILHAVRGVFVEKGFHAATTRELAAAAGVSEALLFKHFPSKEALYTALQMSCFKQEHAAVIERLEALEPSAATLAFLIHTMAAHMLGDRVPDDNERAFVRLILRSLMDEGDFARIAIQTAPARWVKKVQECLAAAVAAGEALPGPVDAHAGAWFVKQLVGILMLHLLPGDPVINYGVSRGQLIEQVVWFSLRGLGIREEVIQRCCTPEAWAAFTQQTDL